jgi:hypothetical protein
MNTTPDQLRRAISRHQTRSILTAAIAALAWLASFILLAKLAGPFDRSRMLPLTATFLLGGLAAMILPLYLLTRRLAPRCPACGQFLCTGSIADTGTCPRCHLRLFDQPTEPTPTLDQPGSPSP